MRSKLNGALFVVVTKEVYVDFLNGKKYELRRLERQWNKERVQPGRKVVVGCGYSGPRLWGTVGREIVVGSLWEIFHRVPFFAKIEPRARSRQEAIKLNQTLLGNSKQYIAFEIIFERAHA